MVNPACYAEARLVKAGSRAILANRNEPLPVASG